MPFAITIDERSATPKYRQIANCIVHNIERKEILKEEQLPSINQLSLVYNISRDTAEKAYKLLKTRGVIRSVRGKGYYASQDTVVKERRVLLVFNKLSSYKEQIYQSFLHTIGTSAWVDLQIYYEKYETFERIISERAKQFTDIVIIPSFKGTAAHRAADLIKRELKDKNVLILNRDFRELNSHQGSVVQNYRHDICEALTGISSRLESYDRIMLHFPFDSNYPTDIIRGMQECASQHNMKSEVIFKNFAQIPLRKGDLHIVLKDEQLVTLAGKIQCSEMTLGTDLGILAYNDSPLKRVVLGGISVMTTDHSEMGRRAAHMLLHQQWASEEVPFSVVDRGSL